MPLPQRVVNPMRQVGKEKLVRQGNRVSSVARQMEEATGKRPTIVDAASKFGRKGGEVIHRTNDGCGGGEHSIPQEDRMAMPTADHGKKGGESSCGKSKSSDGQSYLIEEIDLKNNMIKIDTAWYAETFFDIIAT